MLPLLIVHDNRAQIERDLSVLDPVCRQRVAPTHAPGFEHLVLLLMTVAQLKSSTYGSAAGIRQDKVLVID